MPWVCQRQKGRMANITTWPVPSGASTTCARFGQRLAAHEHARQQHLVGVRGEAQDDARRVGTAGRHPSPAEAATAALP